MKPTPLPATASTATKYEVPPENILGIYVYTIYYMK